MRPEGEENEASDPGGGDVRLEDDWYDQNHVNHDTDGRQGESMQKAKST